MTAARTIIRNAVLLDLDPLQVRRGELRVEMGMIVAVGPQVEAVAGDVVIDAGGAVVMPGLVNGHTHLYSALAVGMPPPAVSPRDFHEILQHVWWRLDRALDLPLIEASATIGALDALHCGTTTLIDHHASPNAIDGSLDAIEAGLRKVGVRGVLCYEATDRNGLEGRDAGLRENERYLHRCGTNTAGTGETPVSHRRDAGATPHQPEAGATLPGPDTGATLPHPDTGATLPRRESHTPQQFAALVGAHAAFTMSDESLRATADLARRFGTGVHIHVAEDPCDARICREQFGAELFDRLDRAGILELPSILAHGTHLSESDLARVNASVVSIAHNARSNMNNAVGYAPLARIRRPVQLGTDGIGSDMLSELQTAWFKWRDSLCGGRSALMTDAEAEEHRQDAGATHGQDAGATHGRDARATHGQDADPTHGRDAGAASGQDSGARHLGPADFVQMLVDSARRASVLLGTALGRFARGAAADIVVTDYVPATPLHDDNAAAHLIFALGARHVRHVMVAGKWRLRDRVATTMDEAAFRRKNTSQASRLWERMAEL